MVLDGGRGGLFAESAGVGELCGGVNPGGLLRVIAQVVLSVLDL